MSLIPALTRARPCICQVGVLSGGGMGQCDTNALSLRCSVAGDDGKENPVNAPDQLPAVDDGTIQSIADI